MTYEWQIFELREGYDQDKIRHFQNSFKYDRTYQLANTIYDSYCMSHIIILRGVPNYKTKVK